LARFYDIEPTLENSWRSVILFGRNSATYKFAFGKSLLELSERGNDSVSLEDLGERFSSHIAEHVKLTPKQNNTAAPPKFIEVCQQFNQGAIGKTELVDFTVKRAFNDVIDAFHRVGGKDVSNRFYVDERNTNGGIKLTDNIYALLESDSAENLSPEVEARWRLVETAWELNLPSRVLSVDHDLDEEELFVTDGHHRKSITSSRDALNGYQKSKCFHCYGYISVCQGSNYLGHVDHFFPHILKSHGVAKPVDGVWNLVLACSDCNGAGGKSAKVPSLELLKRLHRRNEYLISSSHPLKETLILQTGSKPEIRQGFLQKNYNAAKELLHHTWEPSIIKGNPTF